MRECIDGRQREQRHMRIIANHTEDGINVAVLLFEKFSMQLSNELQQLRRRIESTRIVRRVSDVSEVQDESALHLRPKHANPVQNLVLVEDGDAGGGGRGEKAR